MKKLALLLLLIAGPAFGQRGDGYTPSPGCYQLGGCQLSSSTAVQSLVIGPFSGASLAAATQFVTGLGAYVFESAQGGLSQENAAFGMGAAIACTTCSASVFLGTGAGSAETTAGTVIAIGDTAMRNSWDLGSDVVVGNGGSYGDGVVGGSTPGDQVVIGNQSLVGSAATITVGATMPTIGDTYPFTLSTANACGTVNCTSGAPQTVTYTVTSGDTTTALFASHLATYLTNNFTVNYVLGDGAAENSRNLYNDNFSVADATNHPLVIKGHYPGSWQLTLTAGSCTGTCTETVTVGAGLTGVHNTLTGNKVLAYFGATTPTQNAIHGSGSFNTVATTASYNATNGYAVAPVATTASYNAVSGNQALNDCTTCQQNVIVGAFGAFHLTTGQKNTLVGDMTTGGNQSCVTTGQNNTELGQGACVPSPTTNHQLSIQNIIYGTGNSGTGASVSAGSIGIGQTSPGARFDILGTDTSSGTLAFRVQNSTPATAFSISDSGVIAMPLVANVTTAVTGTLCWSAANITYDGTNTCLVSSARFKHDVQPLTGALAKIDAMRPVSFLYNGDVTDDPHIGLIAEEVVKIDPRLVANDNDGKPLKVKYIDAIAMLISAIQDQQKEIDDLRRTVNH
jgi:hypothetical protein